MSDEYFQKITELNTAEVPFVVTTVIKITGSVSANQEQSRLSTVKVKPCLVG